MSNNGVPLKSGYRGHSGSLKMTPHDGPCTTSYQSAIVKYTSMLYRFRWKISHDLEI